MPGKLRRLIAIAAVLVGVAGCSGKGQDPNDVGDALNGAGAGAIHIFPATDREAARTVTGTTLQGQPLSLASYRGKVVVVNFWSSTCAPCQYEAQAFAGLAKEDASKGVQFVGIDERDNKASAVAYEQEYHVAYPSIFDTSDAFLLDFPGSVPSATPFTIILDRTGRIAARVNGSLDYTSLRTLVNRVLTESA